MKAETKTNPPPPSPPKQTAAGFADDHRELANQIANLKLREAVKLVRYLEGEL